jgi:RNA polymerase-binding transcription factor
VEDDHSPGRVDSAAPTHHEVIGDVFDAGEFDMAGGDAATDDIDIDALDRIEQELADVELALERLGDGTYGRCEACGQLLDDDELEAAPAGRFCRAHLPLDPP